jgi:hypothetical protein
MINVSELIGDPDFCQPNGVTVTRRPMEIVNHKPSYTEQNLKLTGIITISDEQEDEMLPEADRNKEAINIFTYNRLFCTGYDRDSGKDYMADIVTFENVNYKVAYCLNDAQYGFCRSKAVKMDQEVM